MNTHLGGPFFHGGASSAELGFFPQTQQANSDRSTCGPETTRAAAYQLCCTRATAIMGYGGR
jgi:hypothetical protein